MRSNDGLHALILVLLWLCFVSLSACTVDASKLASKAASHHQSANRKVENRPDIRTIDFRNYSYPVTCEIAEFFEVGATVVIANGISRQLRDKSDPSVTIELRVESVDYTNVNGNQGDEEAVVVLSVEGKGSAMNELVYIFGIRQGGASVLWKFDTGDRSHGGLRQVYGHGGDLVVERYNNDFSRSDDGAVQAGGACCATTYTRAVYQWTGLRFQLILAERMANPARGASRVR